ncbi:MAG: cation diffusion facilitator family transporter [Thermofilaceae archaeon]
MSTHYKIEKLLLASILGNAVVCSVKILGGLISGSTALLADGSDSLLNVVSGVIAYKSFCEAGKPPDEEHPYGHSKFEIYGSMLILVFMVATFSFVGFIAVDRLLHGLPETINPIGVLFASISLSMNFIVSGLLKLWGRESPVAVTESRHVTLDVVEGIVTLAGVSLGATLSSAYDAVAAFILLVLVTIFVSRTLRELRKEVLDTSPPSVFIQDIEEVLSSISGVVGFHDLRARVSAGRVYADVHLVVEGNVSVEKAHEICDTIERKLKDRFNDKIDIIIHVEPMNS